MASPKRHLQMEGRRRSKRLRFTPADDDDIDLSDDGAAALKGQSFFQVQPAEVLATILRQMSKRPRNNNWPTYLSPRDMAAVLGTRSKLADAARGDLTSINKWRTYYCDDHDSNNGLLLDSRYDSNLLAPLLGHLGASLHAISYDSISIDINSELFSAGGPKTKDYRLLDRCLFERCTSELKMLTLGKFGDGHLIEPILNIVGKHLETLQILETPLDFIVPSSLIGSIADNCTKLKWLTLLRPTLRERSLEDLWKGLGKTLERLTIDISQVWHGKRDKTKHMLSPECIIKYCTRLSRVDIFAQRNASCRRLYADLLTKLQDRLKVIRIATARNEETMEPSLSQMISNRPDLIVDAEICSLKNGNEFLQVLGPRLRSLCIRGLYLNEHQAYDWGNCPNVESFSLTASDALTGQFLERILATSKRITAFDYTSEISRESVAPIIRIIAGGMPLLHTLTISTYEPLSNQCIDTLGKKLKKLRKFVSRRHYASSNFNEVDAAVYTIRKVAEKTCFPAIEEVEIDDSNIKGRSSLIANAAFSCTKKVDLFVSGNAYRTAVPSIM